MIALEQVRHNWGRFSLDVSLHVGAGEYFVILGPSGAGKSLLLKTLVGAYRPSAGRVVIDGTDFTDAPPQRRRVGMVFQNYLLFPHLSVRANIEYGRQCSGPGLPADAMDWLIELLGLAPLMDRSPVTLSCGEQQRVALARAMAIQPRVLCLDEPLGPLDQNVQWGLRRELLAFHKAFGVTTLHVTHDHGEAMALADRIGVMFDGRMIQVGAADDIFYRPANARLAAFVLTENVLPVRAEPGVVRMGDVRLAAPAVNLTGPAFMCIRPELLERVAEPGANVVAAAVRAVARDGHMIVATLEVATGTAPSTWTIRGLRRDLGGLALDAQIFVRVPPEWIHCFKD